MINLILQFRQKMMQWWIVINRQETVRYTIYPFHSRSNIRNFQDHFHVIYYRTVAGLKSDRFQRGT